MPPPDQMPPTGFLADFILVWYVAFSLAILAVLFVRAARRRPADGRAPLVLGNALVLVALVAVAGAVAETWHRYVHDATDSYGLTMGNAVWFRRHVRLNAAGMRDHEWVAEKPARTERVVFLGDSFTFGYGVDDPAERFPDRVAAGLQGRLPAIQVWNAGGIGWSTGDQANWLAVELAGSRADRVVLAYCLNDLDDLVPEERRFVRGSLPLPPGAPWQSFALDAVWYRYQVARHPRLGGYFGWMQDAYDDGGIWTAQAGRMELVARICRATGVRLDVVVFPFFDSWGAEYPFDRAHDRVVDAWRRQGVQVLDLRETYQGRDATDLVAGPQDAHPGPLAHELAADAIVRSLFGGE